MPEGSFEKPVAETPAVTQRPRRRWLRPALMLGGVVAMVVGGGWYWLQGGGTSETDDAYVQADKLLVANDISGIVSRIAVHEGDQVRQGDLLFQLDAAPFRNAVDAARAQVQQTALSLAAMQADYQRMLRDMAAQEAAVQLAQVQFDRQAQLVGNGAVSRATYDQSRFGLVQAQQQLESLRAQAQVQLARLGGAADTPVRELPQYLGDQARLAEAERQLAHTVVMAPFDGTVTQVAQLQPGQYLAAATPAFALVSASNVWVEAQPKETDLTHVRPGEPVTVTVDTYPGTTWRGTVESISPASGGTFSILPAQNSSGNWVKVVQRIPVRIRVDRPAGSPPLRAGMSVEVSIETGHQRHLSDLF